LGLEEKAEMIDLEQKPGRKGEEIRTGIRRFSSRTIDSYHTIVEASHYYKRKLPPLSTVCRTQEG
jgi:hypothetical protein